MLPVCWQLILVRHTIFCKYFYLFLAALLFFTNAWEKNILPFFCGLSGVPPFGSIALRQRYAPLQSLPCLLELKVLP